VTSERESVRRYFDREAEAFDALYRGRTWDRMLRPAVYRRVELARALCRDRAVLDVGCGTARVAIALCDAGASAVTGIDFSTVMIEQGRSIVDASPYRDRITLDVADFLQFRPNGTWPLVLALGVFEYFEDLSGCVTAVAPLVGETLAFSVRRFTALRGTLRAARYRLAGCPIHFASKRTIEQACRGFADVRIESGGAGSYWVEARK
jgi:predicted TPR repeat methyltransferase